MIQLIAEWMAELGIEFVALVTALIYVYLANKKNRWCFLFGLISSAIYVYICIINRFYFDTAINIYYVAMSFYGFVVRSKRTNNALEIRSLSKKTLLVLSVCGVVTSIILAYTAELFTDAQMAYVDAFTTVLAIIATYMVVKQYLENWLIWIVVDAVASYMYFVKELHFIGLLYAIYTVIAILGYRNWKKQLSF